MHTTVVSYRALDHHPGRCYDYEFEDCLIDLLGAELIAPHRPEPGTFLRRRREDTLASVPLSGQQDLLFVNVMAIWDLHALSAIPAWRSSSRLTVCWIKEFFACTEIPRSELQVLQQFDLVILNFGGSVDVLRQQLPGTEVVHLPLGIDTRRFDPYPAMPARGIDVHSVGRHDPELHDTLFTIAEREGLHYQFNSAYPESVSSHSQHRALFGSRMKRTALFVVQPAKFNDPKTTGGQEEIGYRYFEGASSGAVMIGRSPRTGSVQELFPWPDAVIELPKRTADVADLVLELLGRDHESRRRASVVHCLRRHDWVYRIEALLAKMGVQEAASKNSIQERCDALQEQAERIEALPDHDVPDRDVLDANSKRPS
jgi:Glycosyl transferases group 1